MKHKTGGIHQKWNITDFMFAEVSLNLGNMKRINMINIHSEKRSLEEFMKNLEDEDQGKSGESPGQLQKIT